MINIKRLTYAPSWNQQGSVEDWNQLLKDIIGGRLHLVYTLGLPGSGKTKMAADLYALAGGHLALANKDSIRLAHPEYNENTVLKCEDDQIANALAAGQSILVHDTNFHPKHLGRFTQFAAEYSAELVCLDFTGVPMSVCIARDKQRTGSARVGAHVIKNMANKYLIRQNTANRQLLKPVELATPSSTYAGVWPVDGDNRRPAYMCDLDGTLALWTERRAYDEHLYHTDQVNINLRQVLYALASCGNFDLLFLSGREGTETGREETWKWLKANLMGMPLAGQMHESRLIMRKAGDHRADEIVKLELYKEYVESQWMVLGVFDDRPKVVRMWRDEGLFVMDCGNGYEF